MMKSLVACAALCVAMVSAEPLYSSNDIVRRAQIRDYVNSLEGSTWKAKISSKFAGTSFEVVKSLCGAQAETDPLPLMELDLAQVGEIPEAFDGRTAWPECPTFKDVRDQSLCGSCWAFATVEAASDRICVATKGATQVHLSARDLLSCCPTCGAGCNGGQPSAAWRWLTNAGVVQGGDYGDESLCSMYPFPQCEHHNNGTTYPQCSSMGSDYPTPKCQKSCDANSTYAGSYDDDKHRFKKAYSVSSNIEKIQADIMTYGSVGAAFTVYEDFESYSEGVYSHVTGQALGGHAISIRGWGTDAGVPYWLAANSWNSDWGEDGFFRIIRGDAQKNGGFEQQITAGLWA